MQFISTAFCFVRQQLLYGGGSALSVTAGLLVVAIFLAACGRNPLSTYAGIWSGGFGDQFALTETLVTATPIMLCALAVACAGWVGLMNVGVEGQLLMGAIGAAAVALNCHTGDPWVMLPLMGAAACVCAALWSAIPAALRVTLNVNEAMVSLLLNYVAALFLEFLIHGPWQDPTNTSWPQTAAFEPAAELPHFLDSRMHLGLFFGLIIAGLAAVLLAGTKMGYKIKVVSANPAAAKTCQYRVAAYIFFAMIVSGAIAGLAGFGQVSAIEGRLRSGLSPGYGYTGFPVAWLARQNPIAIVVVSIVLGGFLSGADNLQLSDKLPFAVVNILQGVIFFFLLGSDKTVRSSIKHLLNHQPAESFAESAAPATQAS